MPKLRPGTANKFKKKNNKVINIHRAKLNAVQKSILCAFDY